MPPERHPPDSAAEWLNRARSDLALAKSRCDDVYLEDLCFHAQQAVEKAIKAVFISYKWKFPYIHDLSALLTALLNHGMEIPARIQDCVVLTKFAVEGRYPGFGEALSEDEYQSSIATAEDVMIWVQTIIK